MHDADAAGRFLNHAHAAVEQEVKRCGLFTGPKDRRATSNAPLLRRPGEAAETGERQFPQRGDGVGEKTRLDHETVCLS